MSKEHSFKDYIEQQYCDSLFNAVSDFALNHISDLGLKSDSIDMDYLDEDHVFVDDTTFEIKNIYVNGDNQNNDLEFDILCSVSIQMTEYSNRYGDTEDDYTVWFRISCSATLDGVLKNFTIKSVDPYQRGDKNLFKRKLSDKLVPIISKESLDFEASLFLKQYFPRALEFPKRLDPLEIAEKMGLTVVYKEITPDVSVFGQIYFRDTVVDGELVKAKTLLVDPRVIDIRGIGALYNTIIHECVHWHKHRLAFELVRLYEPELSNISTTLEKYDGIQSDKMTDTDWMEWHARALAPKILMPDAMFKQRVDFLLREYFLEHPVNQTEAYAEVIQQLAAEFGVSKLSAKIRMVECGYEQAIGAFVYVDDQVVPNHTWKTGTLASDETFTIDEMSLMAESSFNPELMKVLNEGRYIFVESHVVKRSPKYVEKDIFDNVVLTNYARQNMHECALTFSISLKNGQLKLSNEVKLAVVLNRLEESPYELTVRYKRGVDARDDDDKLDFLVDNLIEQDKIFKKLNGDFSDCMNAVLDWRNTGAIEMAKLVNTDASNYRKFINGKSGSIDMLVESCIRLYLPYDFSNHLIEVSRFSLDNNNVVHICYKRALQIFVGRPWEDVLALIDKATEKSEKQIKKQA